MYILILNDLQQGTRPKYHTYNIILYAQVRFANSIYVCVERDLYKEFLEFDNLFCVGTYTILYYIIIIHRLTLI